MPPAAHAAAVARQFAVHQLGNASWDIVYGEVLPEVATWSKPPTEQAPAEQLPARAPDTCALEMLCCTLQCVTLGSLSTVIT